ncbi:TrmB family transcriptional regulator [Candidatus Woesearchaeota archaeon]|nr:TrmB family transcriptional regulator [Candidatus Woesearchaeota archaeon]
MIVQQDFLKKIKDFGLNTYEAKIWTALLSRGVATAGELSDISNVPRSRSYDILESLEKKGFIIMKLGKPIKYIAVPPEEVVERVKKRVHEETAATLKTMDELYGSDVLKELTQLHNNGIDTVEPEDLTGSVKGQNNIYEHLNLMIKEAEERITLITSEGGLNRKGDALLRQLKKAAERGVQVRVAAPLTEKNMEGAKAISEFAEVKDLKGLNARFMIIDTTQVLFMLADDTEVHPSYDVGVWVNTQLFAQALEQLFDLAWDKIKVKA